MSYLSLLYVGLCERVQTTDDSTRIYAMEFAGMEVCFKVDDRTLIVSEVRSGT